MKKYFILLFVSLSIFIFNTANSIKNESLEKYKDNKTKESYSKYKVTYNTHKEFADIVFNTLIYRDDIISAFEQKNRELLKNILLHDYKELKKFNIKQLHFHLKNNVSFLRMHRPDKYGDDLTKIRPTVAYVNRYKKPIDGFEEGKIFNGFRYVFPLFNKQNIHIGSVEISFSALLFIKEFYKNYNMRSNLYIKKEVVAAKLFKSEKSNYEDSLFKNYYEQKSIVEYINKNNLNSLNLDENMYEIIEKKLLKNKNFSIFNDEQLITFLFLKNPITKKNIAFFTITTNDNYKVEHERNMFIIVGLILTILLIVMIIFYKSLSSNNKIKNDLEEKKRKNQQLKDLSKKLKDNLQMYSDHIIYSKTDLEGNIIEVSDAFCKISEYSREELLGKKHNIIRNKNMSEEIYKNMWKTLINNQTWKGEIQNISKNGNIYWISSTIYAEYDSSGEKIGYIAIAHNITNTKKVEQQHNRLMQTDKLVAMGEMITNISHQWRQPLSIISTSATGILMQTEMDNINKEFLTKASKAINQNTQFLSKTIDEFRNYVSVDDIVQNVELKEIVEKFKNLISYSLKLDNINFVSDIEEGLIIECSKNSLIQCLINFFNNSKDAFDKKDIKDKLFILKAYKEDNKIIIIIKDNAHGIDEKIINKIFEPYFTTKHQSQGTGLGLHMCYKLITDNMQGIIEIENKRFEYNNTTYMGACFKIIL